MVPGSVRLALTSSAGSPTHVRAPSFRETRTRDSPVRQIHALVRISTMSRTRIVGLVGIALLLAILLRLRILPRPENQKPGKFPEQLVYVRSADDLVDTGVLFTSARLPSRPLAIIWVHGWGANFYTSSYVGIGRALAERGFPTISVNTRMHDIGNGENYTLLGKEYAVAGIGG